ncbi:hypothetical protein Zmor_000394 [Zophobas morio]|uniref:Gustatory receptor n=1 Tax=Zophobas morio TaxID=2755281 RepID=A0AA38MRF5_9CUCU|nr:hypothetical protein Zmor_000394 [Zophobas morio]
MHTKRSKIFTILKVIHFNLKCLGFVHFSLNDLSKNRPSLSKFSILAHIFHIAYGTVAIIIFPKYFSMFQTHTVISQLVGFFTGLLTVLTGLDNIFWSKIYQRKIFKLFKYFYQLDEDFQRAAFDLNYGTVKTAGGVLMTIDVLLSLSLMFVHTMFDKDTIKITLDTQVVVVFLFTFIFWSQATFYCQYVLFTNTARLMFLQIDHELNSKIISVKKYRLCCDLHTKLCDVIRLMNKLYNIQIILLFTSSFVLMTLEVYGAIVHEYEMALTTLISSLYGSALMIYKMWGLIFNAENLTSSANKVRRSLVKLAVIENQQIHKKEIKAFLLYILHDQVKISVGGYFNLNYSLGVNRTLLGNKHLTTNHIRPCSYLKPTGRLKKFIGEITFHKNQCQSQFYFSYLQIGVLAKNRKNVKRSTRLSTVSSRRKLSAQFFVVGTNEISG